jgi:8-oxo-dGTP diphosphatase
MHERKPLFDRLPRGTLPILREVARQILRRPVVGIVALARNSRQEILLVRRGDTGTWALPGGTLEWGEPARQSLIRELDEEAGAHVISTGRLLGVYTAPMRDLRMHGITIVVEATVADDIKGAHNPIEIFDARFFAEHALPSPMAYTFDEIINNSLQSTTPYWE